VEFFADISNHVFVIGPIFTLAGVLHFIYPDKYIKVMPDYIPNHTAMVFWSGIAEVAGGVGIMIPAMQTISGWGLLALLLAVFPANIEMFVKTYRSKKRPILTLLLFLRLPLQFWLMYWVFMAAELGL
jgi:uncharacterized membrane protein